MVVQDVPNAPYRRLCAGPPTLGGHREFPTGIGPSTPLRAEVNLPANSKAGRVGTTVHVWRAP